MLIQATGLKKRYGEFQALHGIDFALPDGVVWGLLGPNGAGKSTTLGILAGTLDPSGGTLLWGGRPWRETEAERRRSLGYVPQELALYDTLSAIENLRFWGRLYGVSGREIEARASEALDLVGLAPRARDLVSTYSGGMKRRLNLAAAILHRPRLLLLDEPMVGVDPQSRNLLLGVLQELRRQGMSMIYTSHYMQEVETLCDRVAIIDHGRMLAEDSLTGLLEQSEGDEELIHPSLESVFLSLTGTALRD